MKIVLCHGTFDFLHYGHLKLFEYARKLGTMVVVTLTADQYVNKGPGRPLFSQKQRAFCVERCKDVDVVEICFHKTGLPMIEKYQPDIYLKGEDYKTFDRHDSLDTERRAVESYGGRLVFAENLPRFSSTRLIETLRSR